MTLLPTRYCDVCRRPMTDRYLELRIVACTNETDGRSLDTTARTETCSPACSLTAARATTERAWDRAS